MYDEHLVDFAKSQIERHGPQTTGMLLVAFRNLGNRIDADIPMLRAELLSRTDIGLAFDEATDTWTLK